jgi:hypothetical protein
MQLRTREPPAIVCEHVVHQRPILRQGELLDPQVAARMCGTESITQWVGARVSACALALRTRNYRFVPWLVVPSESSPSGSTLMLP